MLAASQAVHNSRGSTFLHFLKGSALPLCTSTQSPPAAAAAAGAGAVTEAPSAASCDRGLQLLQSATASYGNSHQNAGSALHFFDDLLVLDNQTVTAPYLT